MELPPAPQIPPARGTSSSAAGDVPADGKEGSGSAELNEPNEERMEEPEDERISERFRALSDQQLQFEIIRAVRTNSSCLLPVCNG